MEFDHDHQTIMTVHFKVNTEPQINRFHTPVCFYTVSDSLICCINVLCLISYKVSDEEYQTYNYGVCHKVFWVVLYLVCHAKGFKGI